MPETGMLYFFEAATLGSMRLASEKVGVAVSSISRQVAQLEAELGVQLLERGRRSIKLTEAGRVTYEFYKEQIASKEALLTRLRDLRELKVGNVEIAVGEGFLGRSFTDLIDAYQTANPGITVSVMSFPTVEIERLVLDDQAHFGLILHTSTEPKIRVRASVGQPLLVVCAPDHPLVGQSEIRLADLQRHPIALPPADFRIRRMLAAAEKREHIWLEPRLISNSIHVLRERAKGGGMVTVLPRIAVLSELEEGSLVGLHLFERDMEDATISLIHRLGRQLEGAPARMLALFEAKLKTWNEGAASGSARAGA
ncbi:LysR family transcriptional regulator [Sphingosinicella sp. CPCC 101087]|uniref:LysR family transcriptional regulator n=1 Tax=Sphingosinicella sp. CPCC 101087 TaxID=2497754 RepID=UPI00101CBF75|nr:LysR family transcriptional regulator [Sphingosinicella sp. CPCC 101087]